MRSYVSASLFRKLAASYDRIIASGLWVEYILRRVASDTLDLRARKIDIMHIPDWVAIVSVNAALLAGVAFILWIANAIVDLLDENARRKRFDKDLSESLLHGQPDWNRVLDFAALRGVTPKQVNWTLRVLVREILTGRNTELQEQLSRLQAYLALQKESEPFEGMPNEIRIHLERLRDKGHEVAILLEPLTTQIRDLLALKSREYSRQKRYTFSSFVLGVIALVFAGLPYIYPPSAASSDASKNQTVTPGK